MKALAFFSCLLAGSAACAAVTSDATFGVLKVASNNKETVISVPWVSATNLNTSVAVKDFVKTTGMTDGDELYLYDNNNGTYKLWVFDASENKWKGTLKVSAKITSITGESAGSDTNLIARGSALIIARQNPTTSDIYLYGQYNSSAPSAPVVTRDAEKVVSSLFAPWNVSGDRISLNALASTAENDGKQYLAWDATNKPVDGDIIRAHSASGKTTLSFTYKESDGKWGRMVGTSRNTETAYINAGMGAWYVAKPGSGTVEFTVATVAYSAE